MVKLQVLGNNSKTVNNIKNDQHSKVYLPCNFEVNLITHLIFSNSGHVGWCTASPDTFLKLDTVVMIQTKFGFHWSSTFRGEDLNVIFYQNMLNLHNRYISAERKISQKNPEYRLNYFLHSWMAPFQNCVR
jgi:hypothetical protein